MEIIFFLAIIIFSVVLHEVSHGWVANSLGDPTARLAGRLTLNPLPHIDPIGSIIVPGLLLLLPGAGIIAWAKPVPVNPLNFRDPRFDQLKVSIAGPGANIALALVFGVLLRFLLESGGASAFIPIIRDIVFLNLILAAFNLVPIPPLDGSHVLFSFLSPGLNRMKLFLQQYGFFLLLAFIFLIPGIFFGILIIPINILFLFIVGAPFYAIPGIVG